MNVFFKIISFIIILFLVAFVYDNEIFKEIFRVIGMGSTIFTLSIFVYFVLDNIYQKIKFKK